MHRKDWWIIVAMIINVMHEGGAWHGDPSVTSVTTHVPSSQRQPSHPPTWSTKITTTSLNDYPCNAKYIDCKKSTPTTRPFENEQLLHPPTWSKKINKNDRINQPIDANDFWRKNNNKKPTKSFRTKTTKNEKSVIQEQQEATNPVKPFRTVKTKNWNRWS